ncbi:Na+/H+ antiporter NhaC family protein, partial [Lishizhenia sp.]|uniref:Na+/H+ antiporter NhaC family protein n=1 Tax=Lishizhenia sp. TaxID=2497594 RepID=UPI00299D50EC
IAFITTWIGAELTYISDGVNKITAAGGEITEGAYGIFINSLAYSFYPIFTLFFMFFMLYKQKDFGPMLRFERKALKEGVDYGADNDESTLDLKEFETKQGVKPKAFNALLPILTVVFGTIIGLVYTGLTSCEQQILDTGASINGSVWANLNLLDVSADGFFRKLGLVIGNADSYAALLWSSLSGLTLAILLTVSQGIMDLKDTMESVMTGIKTMLPAIVILVLAWSLANVTEELHTADYLKSFFAGEFKHVWIIPSLTFVLSAIIAFSTGSSWSTMALMYPLVIPLSFTVASDVLDYDATLIMYNTIASVLAGSVLGDHCSPISDTTILSSLASSCNHINHVKSQMPYALTVGGVALFFGIIPGALGISSFITMPLGIVILYLVVHFLGKDIDNEVAKK